MPEDKEIGFAEWVEEEWLCIGVPSSHNYTVTKYSVRWKHTSDIHSKTAGTVSLSRASLAGARIIFTAATRARVNCPSSNFCKSPDSMTSGVQHVAFGLLSPKSVGVPTTAR